MFKSSLVSFSSFSCWLSSGKGTYAFLTFVVPMVAIIIVSPSHHDDLIELLINTVFVVDQHGVSDNGTGQYLEE